MTLRHVVVLLLALVVAVPAWACVPDPPTEAVEGADALKAGRIDVGVEDVVGRPATIPAGMGGGQALDTSGDSGNNTTGGNQTGNLTFDDATGTTQGAVTDKADGGKTITPSGDTDFSQGTFSNGTQGRQIAPGTGNGRTSGGTIELNPRDPANPNDQGPLVTTDGTGRITFEGTGRVKDATTIEINGGTSFIPGSPAIRVEEGKPRLDSNVVYGEKED